MIISHKRGGKMSITFNNLKTWLNENYGSKAADRLKASNDFGITIPTLYKWMANEKYKICQINNKEISIIEIKGSVKQ